jgi:phosphate-selective porin OprO/OprP
VSTALASLFSEHGGIPDRAQEARYGEALVISRRKAEVLALVAAAAFWLPVAGYAQITSDAASQQPAAPAPVQAGFHDGFFIESADGNTRLNIGMLEQTDGRFFVDESQPLTSTFLIRKARPTFTGRILKYFDFKIMPDFGNGTAVLQDAYVDIRFSPKFRVRSGKDKMPVGYEWMIGDAYVLFPERSFVTDLVPNRDVGVQVQGDLFGDRISYAGGVVNGVPDGTSSTTDVDTNGGKDVLGRIVVTPFRSTPTSSRPLDGLGFQIGGSAGRESGALPTFRTPAQQPFFSYDHDATASGTRTRFTPAVFYYHNQFGGYAEYVRSAQTVARNGLETDVANHAWEATGSYLLTGEAATEGIVRPKRDFDPQAGRWGAVQLLARYATLSVDRDAFAAGLAAAGASREARSLGLGVNWYPNPYIKIYGSFERTTFRVDAGSAQPAEHVIIFRTQLAF